MSDVSVIIPSYQHGKTIAACLKSLFAQTDPPKEIIVVDDGSTDETKKIVESFGQMVRYFFQPNQGACAARNAGFIQSTGSLLLFCDADILAHPEMLKQMQQSLISHPEVSYVYSSFRWGKKLFLSRPFDASRLKQNNFIHTTSLIRRCDFPGFDPSIKRFQDWDLWLTMLERGHIGFWLEEELFTVLQAPGRVSISKWIPSLAYKFPWKVLGWKPKRIKEYEEARKIIVSKHQL